jgi:hypothetical protein
MKKANLKLSFDNCMMKYRYLLNKATKDVYCLLNSHTIYLTSLFVVD